MTGNYSTLQIISRMIGLVRVHIPLLIAGMICEGTKQLVTIAIGLLGVLLIFTATGGSSPSVLLPIGASIIILALVRGICGYLGPYLNHVTAFRILSDLRNSFYLKIDPLAPAVFISRRTGDLVSIAINNIEMLELFFAHTLVQIVIGIIIPLIVILALAWIHFDLALILLIFLLMAALVTILTILFNERKGERLRKYLAQLHSFLIDSVQGIWEILAFGYGKNRLSLIIRMILDYRKEQRAYVRVNACASAAYAILVSAGIIAVLVETALLSEAGVISVIFLPITVILSAGALGSIKDVIEVSKQLSLTLAGARRFFDVMDDIPAVTDKETNKSILSAQPSLEVNNIWFRYSKTDPYVLKGVNFSLPSGSITAVVGITGAGKTTLAHLLMRFWDPEEGVITFDGHDLKDLKLIDIRKAISVVTQDIFLFNASIKENIRIGKADATDMEVERAARFSRIHEFIEILPDGYNTIVGERGIRLSGGERQRIAIARAILKNAPVLILDEATSNLDTITEMQIRETIQELMKGRTVFMIAHRLCTVVHADKILVLNNGEISEHGTHQELINSNGLYAAMVSAQEI